MMMRRALILSGVISVGLAAAVRPAAFQQPEVHPAKQVYLSRADWLATAPGDVTLNAFAPFRAVYERQYRQAGGPNAGETRIDRVIVTAERVGWDGVPAVALHLIDSGIEGQSDTNARALTMFFALDDMRLLFEMGPVPGSAKDYYLARVLPDKMVASVVMTAEPRLEPNVAETAVPGFGPTAWVMANMDLQPGRQFRLDPAFSPQSNPLAPGTFGRVIGRDTMTDLGGVSREAWVVETVSSMSNERASRHYLTNMPPYYLGTASWNLETDKERNRFVWLQSFMLLDDGR